MNTSLKNQIEKTFARAISDVKNEGESLRFLQDFFSEKELTNFAKRFAVAYWLMKKRSYENIKTNLNVSSRTIAEVKNLLKKGTIRHAIKKIDADDWAEKRSAQLKKLLKIS